jgi:hypothetical protein
MHHFIRRPNERRFGLLNANLENVLTYKMTLSQADWPCQSLELNDGRSDIMNGPLAGSNMP